MILPPLDNPPGLDALNLRVRTYSESRKSMARAFAHSDVLRSLAHARADDPAMALVDAWAVTLDVLGFYQERIANEGYLRTATEQRSVQELGRAVGYELNPGVAAETYLAFTLEEARAGQEKATVIDAGTKVQSVPGPGEEPQVFETVETIEARPAWNSLKLQVARRRLPKQGDTDVYLKGVNTGLKPGDAILFIGEGRKEDNTAEDWDFRRVNAVEIDRINGRTRVAWDEGLAHCSHEIYALRLRAALFGHNAPDWSSMPPEVQRAYINKYPSGFAASETSAVSGEQYAYPAPVVVSGVPKDWPGLTISKISESSDAVQLDAAYPQIRPGSWIVLSSPSRVGLYKVSHAVEDGRTSFALNTRTTRVTLMGSNVQEGFDRAVRETTVFTQSEKLEPAEAPLSEEFPPETPPEDILEDASTITLGRAVDGLSRGRVLLIAGTRIDTGALEVNCVKVLTAARDTTNGCSVITFAPPLKSTYYRESITVFANVSRTTHGETRREVLGSGEASRSFQRFRLSEAPLTFTPSATPTGGVTSLKVSVNGIEWSHVPALYGLGPRERALTARQGADGKFVVQFGNGIAGARLPTGTENVFASYRVGLGKAGNVSAGQLHVLLSRPLTVRGVTNPQSASGGVDPENAEDARRNVPHATLTIDRVVTLRDYEDFARAFGGVARARADWISDGWTGVILVTVTGTEGRKLGDASYKNLCAAIDKARDPAQHVRVENTEARRFVIRARLLADPRYPAEEVKERARSALSGAFSIARREFGQDVTESEILGLLHSVEGVLAADITEPYPGLDWAHRRRLRANLPRVAGSPPSISPAEMWILAERDAIGITIVSDLSEPEQPEDSL